MEIWSFLQVFAGLCILFCNKKQKFPNMLANRLWGTEFLVTHAPRVLNEPQLPQPAPASPVWTLRGPSQTRFLTGAILYRLTDQFSLRNLVKFLVREYVIG